MRAAVILTVLVLSGCASEKLALTPPAGVDLSGHWALNEAESDDPQRLIQNQNNPLPGTPGQSQSGQGPQGGGSGRGGGRGRGGGPGGGPGGFGGPGGGPGGPTASPAMIGALGEGLRWPGKDVEVKQVAGVVAFTSGGRNRVFTPSDGEIKPPPGKRKAHESERDDDGEELGPLREHAGSKPPDNMGSADSGDAPGAGRPGGPGGPGRGRADAPISACGWDGRTLVVQASGGHDDRNGYEQRFLLSQDGDRLIQIVGRKGAHGEGFTLSRVWDRVTPGPAPAAESRQ